MILLDPKSEKIQSDRIGFGFGLVSDRICTSLIHTIVEKFRATVFSAGINGEFVQTNKNPAEI